MKEKDIQFDNYDYIMFVDASGDDGFQFRENPGDGSSSTFVASCFVVRPEDINHNEDVLEQIKGVLNISPQNELKSTTLKRHRLANRAYALINDLKGQCFSMIAFKKDLVGKDKYKNYCDVKAKELSGLTQAFPYYAINKLNYFSSSDRILIVMDCMKKSEMDVVEKNLKEYQISPTVSENYDLIFRDSKDARYTLIQIADIFAGIIREYFEKNLQRNVLQRSCKICKNKARCATPKIKKALSSQKIENKYVVPLLMHRSPTLNKIMLFGIITLPLKHFEYYKYVDCKLNNKKRS